MTSDQPLNDTPVAKSKKRLRWFILIVLIAFVAVGIYQGWTSLQKKSAKSRPLRAEIPVQISPVVRKHLLYSIYASGDITPLMQVDLYPKVTGYLERINVNIGESVRQGQVIAQIDRTEFLQKIRESEAKVAHAKAQLSEIQAGSRPEELRQAEETVRQAQSRFENAKLNRERIEALFKRKVISKKEMDSTEMEYNVAEAQLASSLQNLKLVKEGARQEVREASQAKLKEMEALLSQEQTRLQHTIILAPFQGEVVRRHVDTGALVSSSTPLVSLVHTETLKVVINVLEKDIPLLKPGMKVKIRTDAYPERVFEGKVSRINTALDTATRTLQAEIYISNPDRTLKPGMFVKIEVVLAEKPQALVIPRYALIEEGGSPYVFIVKENLAFRKSVVTGYEQDQFVEILEGLSEGDRVVVRGQQMIKDGWSVRVVEGG